MPIQFKRKLTYSYTISLFCFDSMSFQSIFLVNYPVFQPNRHPKQIRIVSYYYTLISLYCVVRARYMERRKKIIRIFPGYWFVWNTGYYNTNQRIIINRWTGSESLRKNCHVYHYQKFDRSITLNLSSCLYFRYCNHWTRWPFSWKTPTRRAGMAESHSIETNNSRSCLTWVNAILVEVYYNCAINVEMEQMSYSSNLVL